MKQQSPPILQSYEMAFNGLEHPVLLVGLAFLLYTIISCSLRRRRNDANARRSGCEPVTVPAKPWWDFINLISLVRLLRASRQGLLFDLLEEMFTKLSERGGYTCRTFAVHRSLSTTFLTLEVENIKALLTTNREDYTLEKRVGWFGPLIGSKSFFTTDGEAWAHNRAILRPAMARERFSDLVLAEKHNENLAHCLVSDSSGWTGTIDLLPLFFCLTMDSFTEFLLGESVNSQVSAMHGHSMDKNSFAVSFDRAQEMLSKRMLLDGLYWLADSLPFRRACRRCHEVVEPYIERALQAHSIPKVCKGADGTTKARYILIEELAKQMRDPIDLRDYCMGLLLAGRDTTATFLGWMFYYLARDPETYAELRTTIIAEFGSADRPGHITYEKLKGCKPLQWCMSETLRLRPSVPLNGFNAVRDTVMPKGGGSDGAAPLFIPKGARVGYSVLLMHRDQKLWGENAKEWRPKRWEGRKHGWDYLPFNGGSRICPGQPYALALAAYTMVRLLQRFDRVENCDTDPVTRMTPTLVSCSQTGVKVRLREAKCLM